MSRVWFTTRRRPSRSARLGRAEPKPCALSAMSLASLAENSSIVRHSTGTNGHCAIPFDEADPGKLKCVITDLSPCPGEVDSTLGCATLFFRRLLTGGLCEFAQVAKLSA